MGWFSWLSRRKADPVPARDEAAVLEQQLEKQIADYDVIALVGAYVALGGGAAEGESAVPADPAVRARLRERIVGAVRTMLGEFTLVEEISDTIRDIERGGLPIDVSAFSAQLRDREARAIAVVREYIAASARGGELKRLAWAVDYLFRDEEIDRISEDITSETTRAELQAEALAQLQAVMPLPTAPGYAQARKSVRWTLDDDQPLYPVPLGLDELRARLGPVAAAASEPADEEPENPALLRAFAEATSDAEEREAALVLSDWLQEQGHPRGKLIALGLAAETDPGLARRIDEHVASHAQALLGPLARHRVFGARPDYGLRWRRGYIEGAILSLAEPDALEILEQLIGHRSARLHELALGVNAPDDEPLDAAIALLAERRPPLTALHLIDLPSREHEYAAWHAADLTGFLSVHRDLRTLVLQGSTLELGDTELRALERLAFDTSTHSLEALDELARAHWPSLHSLEIWLDDAVLDPDWLRRELATLDAPKLEHVGLMESGGTDAICAALETTGFARRLRSLDVSFGKLDDAGAERLAAARAQFSRLERLDVSHNHLSSHAIALLRGIYPTVLAYEQEQEG